MQATTTQTAPVTAPAAPPAPATVTIVGADGQALTLVAPKTQAEVSELVSRRREISDQLSNVSERRRALSEEIRSAPDGASRTGLEGRLKVMDERIIQLEADLASTGRQLAAAPSDLKAFTEIAQNRNSGGDDFEGGFFVGGFTVLGATFVVWLFRRWRAKRRGPAPRREIMAESDPRMERIERGMEAIAVEVERISEGQRFVTKLMAESRSPEMAQLEKSST
jgi:hypothetical protein